MTRPSPDPSGEPNSLPLARLLGHAADCVAAVRAGQSLNTALARCPSVARPGTQALAFHALRWLGSAIALRTLLAPKTPPPAVDALVLTALALLWPTAGAPYSDHTLVDQAVAAMRQRAPRSAGFLNAVLRRFVRERSSCVEAAKVSTEGRFNHPAWWVERLQGDWPARWEAILDADNERPPMTLRINARRSDPARYIERLAALGLGARQVGPHAVVLDRPCPVQQLPGFDDGDVSVQDASAQLAAPLLLDGGRVGVFGGGLAGDRPRVLDACAAPGGKTAHLLELADLDVLALDSDPVRLRRVEDTLARLGLHARTLAADAGDPSRWWDGRPFDAILLDAPCSAAGIVRRHPDVRWLRRASDIETLGAGQGRLLDALWPLLRPAGRLVFCTCSVFRDEGEKPFDAFLQRHPDAWVPEWPRAPGHVMPLADNGPDGSPAVATHVPDGFFYAFVEKRS